MKKQYNLDDLIAALANLEPIISKCAYNNKKYSNAYRKYGTMQSKDWKEEMLKYMNQRQAITNVLLKFYSKGEIIDLRGKSVACNDYSRRMIVSLIGKGELELLA